MISYIALFVSRCFWARIRKHYNPMHGWIGIQALPWLYHKERIYTACTAIALESIHLFLGHCIFLRPPISLSLSLSLYIATFLLQIYTE